LVTPNAPSHQGGRIAQIARDDFSAELGDFLRCR
jgi:hypothetical protein